MLLWDPQTFSDVALNINGIGLDQQEHLPLAILHFQVVLKTQLMLQKHENMFTNKMWRSLLAAVLQMRSLFFKWTQTGFPLIHMNHCFWNWAGTWGLCFRRKGVLWRMCPHKSFRCSAVSVQLPAFKPKVDWEQYQSTPQENGAEQRCVHHTWYVGLFWGACR